MTKTKVEKKAVKNYPAKRHHPEQFYLRQGFEVGYKRAVQDVLAWLKENLYGDYTVESDQRLLTDLEKDML